MIVALIGAVAIAAAAPAAEPEALPAWMTGVWISQDAAGEWSEEWWTAPRAGIMFGASRTGKADALTFFEQMRIESGKDGVSFCALPKGQAGGCFKAVSATDSRIEFQNLAHDYPTRIAYWREGADLLAEISGPNGSKPQKWRFKPAN